MPNNRGCFVSTIFSSFFLFFSPFFLFFFPSLPVVLFAIHCTVFLSRSRDVGCFFLRPLFRPLWKIMLNRFLYIARDKASPNFQLANFTNFKTLPSPFLSASSLSFSAVLRIRPWRVDTPFKERTIYWKLKRRLLAIGRSYSRKREKGIAWIEAVRKNILGY